MWVKLFQPRRHQRGQVQILADTVLMSLSKGLNLPKCGEDEERPTHCGLSKAADHLSKA